MDTEVIRGARVSHERASVDQIEAAAGEDARGVVESLLAHDGINEAFAIQTCNRAEAYVVADSAEAGQAALSLPSAGPDDESVATQTERCLDNVLAILAAEGADASDLLKMTIFLDDIDDFDEMNETYATYFDTEPPARSAVEVGSVPKGAALEIEAVADLE